MTELHVEEGEGLEEYKDVDEEEEEEDDVEKDGNEKEELVSTFKSGYGAQCNCSCTMMLSVISTLFVCSVNEPVTQVGCRGTLRE